MGGLFSKKSDSALGPSSNNLVSCSNSFVAKKVPRAKEEISKTIRLSDLSVNEVIQLYELARETNQPQAVRAQIHAHLMMRYSALLANLRVMSRLINPPSSSLSLSTVVPRLRGGIIIEHFLCAPPQPPISVNSEMPRDLLANNDQIRLHHHGIFADIGHILQSRQSMRRSSILSSEPFALNSN